MKKPIKVPAMKLIPDETLSDVLAMLYNIKELLWHISGGAESGDPIDSVLYFLCEATRKLDEATVNGYDVRWRV